MSEINHFPGFFRSIPTDMRSTNGNKHKSMFCNNKNNFRRRSTTYLFLLFFPFFLNIYYAFKILIFFKTEFPSQCFSFFGEIEKMYVYFPQKTSTMPPNHIIYKESINVKDDKTDITAAIAPSFNTQLILQYDRRIIPIIGTLYHSTRTDHYIIRDAYANGHGSWVIDGMLFSPGKSEYNECSYFPSHFDLNKGTLRYVDVDEIIIAGDQGSLDNYGHFILDKLGCIMLLPDEVIQRSCIILSTILPVFPELLKIVGFLPSQMLFFDNNDWVYAKKLHVFTNNRPLNCFGGPPIYKLHKIFRKHFQLNSIEPTKYALFNRKAKSRVISNFNELVEMTHKTFPDYKWEEIPDIQGNLTTVAKTWASIRFIFLIIGANAANGIFMKEGTVICMGSCQYVDHNLLNENVGSHHAVYIYHTGMSHFDKSNNINLNETMKACHVCLYYDKNHRWPGNNHV